MPGLLALLELANELVGPPNKEEDAGAPLACGVEGWDMIDGSRSRLERLVGVQERVWEAEWMIMTWPL